MSAPSTKPVLIAGAGPTGLALALTLTKDGVPVRIIEKDAQYHVGQRGSGLQPRTLELYHFLGVLPDIMQGGRRLVKRCAYEMPGGRTPAKIFEMAPWEESTPSVPFRNPWIIGQSHNEEILRSHLAKLGVHVELNTELVSFEQNESGVTAHVVKHDGSQDVPETVSVSYLVGADGAKSAVRKQLGLTFEGETREQDRIFLTDLEVKGISADFWHTWGDLSSRALYLRPTEYDGVFACSIFGREVDFAPLFNADHEALFKYIRETSNRPELEFGNVKYVSEWRPNIRMANKFDEGRVFIIGDAGHVHSPTGGQGLNSGVQDAYNLAWKLSMVYKGLADPSLLKSYTEERLPVIAEMLGRTTAILDQTIKSKAGSKVNPQLRAKILHQLGVNCRWSAIVVDEQPEAKDVSNAGAYLAEDPTVVYAGDRAPDAPELLNVADASAKPTSLFDIFGPTHHTALVFVANADQAAPVLRSLEGYPEGMVTKVVVLPKGAAKSTVAPGADLTLVDQEGHAHTAYPPVAGGFSIIIVRPDGVVGAIVKDAQGVKRYFDGVFART